MRLEAPNVGTIKLGGSERGRAEGELENGTADKPFLGGEHAIASALRV